MTNDMQVSAIRNIQRYLRQLSYTDPTIPPVPIDGLYDSATREAVVHFQERSALPATGVVDRATFDALYLAYVDSLFEQAPPNAPTLFPRNPADYEVTVGDALFIVYAIQHMLNELGIIHDDLGIYELNGLFSNEEALGIRRFQENVALPVTGRVDRATWNALVTEYNRYTEGHYQ